MNRIDNSNLKYFGLTNDLLFKIVFGSKGNEKLLALLLNALLQLKGKRQIQELEILNPINLPEFKSDKTSIIDVKACDKSGEMYCVEIQVKAHSEILKRVLFYSSASYIKQITRGTKYTDLKKTICLWIMCETMLPEKEIYNKYLIKHDKNNKILTDLIEYHFVELSKFDKDKPAMLCNKFEKWLHILKFGDYYRTEADLPGGLRKETGISEVIQKMSIANTDEQMRYELLARDMFLSDLATDLDAAEKKGIKKAKIEDAMSMLSDGLAVEKVSKYTGLPVDEVKQLQQNLNSNNPNKVSEPATKYKAKRKATKPRKK
jgi:predicted transposase/invertase (TIGR01784 family)